MGSQGHGTALSTLCTPEIFHSGQLERGRKEGEKEGREGRRKEGKKGKVGCCRRSLVETRMLGSIFSHALDPLYDLEHVTAPLWATGASL